MPSELEKLIKNIDDLPLSDFERESLVPSIIDRMKSYLASFERLLPLCDDADNALLIDTAVRLVVANPAIDPSAPAPKAGQEYLQSAKESIKTHWIAELTTFLQNYPDAAAIQTSKQLFRLTQKAQQLAGSVVWCKTSLLSYSLRSFPIIIHKKSGKTVCGLPNEIEIIIYPFLGVLSEMESSASSLIETLKDWGRSKRESRREYVSYLTTLEQARSARTLNRFQILVILFTIVLTLASAELTNIAKSIYSWLLGSPP